MGVLIQLSEDHEDDSDRQQGDRRELCTQGKAKSTRWTSTCLKNSAPNEYCKIESVSPCAVAGSCASRNKRGTAQISFTRGGCIGLRAIRRVRRYDRPAGKWTTSSKVMDFAPIT